MSDIHLASGIEGDSDNYNKGNMQYVYIFIITALCILLVACINYMNLATAKSSNRSKEVGLRKVIALRDSMLVFSLWANLYCYVLLHLS